MTMHGLKFQLSGGETVLCGCVYRSPTCDVDLNGCRKSTQAIVKLISEAYQHNPNLLIAGDFNYKEIDWLNENALPGQQHLQDFIHTLQDCFLYQHVTELTRYQANETPNVLDLILSSEEGMIEDLAYNPPLGESDHICLTFKLQQFHNKKDTRPVHNIFKTNYTAVREELSKPNWHELLNSNFETDYDTFFNYRRNSMEKHSPLNKSLKERKNIYMMAEAIRLKNITY